jgi:hypothetical protein
MVSLQQEGTCAAGCLLYIGSPAPECNLETNVTAAVSMHARLYALDVGIWRHLEWQDGVAPPARVHAAAAVIDNGTKSHVYLVGGRSAQSKSSTGMIDAWKITVSAGGLSTTMPTDRSTRTHDLPSDDASVCRSN